MTPPTQEAASRSFSFKPFAICGGFLFIAACLFLTIRSLRTLDTAANAPASSFTDPSTSWTDPLVQELELPLSAQTKFIALGFPQPSPWPEIHDHARLARVPIMMYHDILPEKEVFFDVTPEELEADFELIESEGLTPISLDWLVNHLRTGVPLPEKPILLTFDDGYGGHYQHVYPLLKKYGYPAVFSIYTQKMELTGGRTSVTWKQLQEMAADPLVTIASHSITHPDDLRTLSDEELEAEVFESKRLLEEKLAVTIDYFTYPVGRSDERVEEVVAAAGYKAALSMDDLDEHFAGDSQDLLTIGRFGQSRLEAVVSEAWGGHPLPRKDGGFNFTTAIRKQEHTVDDISVILITGGRPNTIHADSRYQVPEILEGTDAVAAVDGGFFSLKYLDSNVMIGPVLSANHQQFIPGYRGEIPKLQGRPLVLIGPEAVKFVPFDYEEHNDLAGVLSEMASVTDAFVGAAWLVKNSQPQPAATFGSLFDFDAYRHRAFWGINQAGQPVIGVSKNMVDSVTLGEVLYQLGFRDAVMLDSGASTSLTYAGESLVGYVPRPVPHVVALYPPYASHSVDNKIAVDAFGAWISEQPE
ncbi:MAG: polysaccharide deacetylase family protein [Cyanophyceae cyanobacterium]